MVGNIRVNWLRAPIRGWNTPEADSFTFELPSSAPAEVLPQARKSEPVPTNMLARKLDYHWNVRMKFDNLASLLEDRYGPNAREVEPNHWVFEVMTGDQRSQVVHLILKEHSSDGEDVSRVVADSPIGPKPQRYDLETLLRRNAQLDVGAICIEDFRNEENQLVTYLTLRASHLVSTADFEEMWEMVDKVARVADELEKDIYASDLH